MTKYCGYMGKLLLLDLTEKGSMEYPWTDRDRELYIGGKAGSMKEGIALAAELIDSGRALETLNKLREVSNRPEEEA